MKKTSLLLFFVNYMVYNLTAQNIGIGTLLPDASARLDIYADNKGILIPRVALTALNSAVPVVAPANGLMVYNISTGGTPAITPGFYSWNVATTSWVRLLSANESLWYATATAAPSVNYTDDIYRKSKVGIGTGLNNFNNAVLQIGTGSNTDLGFLVSGNAATLATVPDIGAGSRMMYYPGKAAFRAGYVSGIQWDNSFTGLYSSALGRSVVASGLSAFAAGDSSVASGDYALSLGNGNSASGQHSIAIGNYSLASTLHSTAIGFGAEASASQATAIGTTVSATGNYSLAMGQGTIASGQNSTSLGYAARSIGTVSISMGAYTYAIGNRAIALGNGTVATGNSSTALGTATTSRAFGSVSIGQYNDSIKNSSTTTWVPTDPLFYIGNGTVFNNTSNALVVYKNANSDIKGFTRLGDSAQGTPRIKMKKLTGTSAPTQNTWVNIPHGLIQSKIIGVDIIMNVPGFVNLPPAYTFQANYEYQYQVSTANIVVLNMGANSANILSKNFTVLITYEE